MFKIYKRKTVFLIVVMIVSVLLPVDLIGTGGAVAIGAPSSIVNRLSGLNRTQTAVSISKEGWPIGSSAAVLTRDDDFPDALAGAPLAYAINAPILLTNTTSLSPETSTEIDRLHVKKVFILGLTGAVSLTVEQQLKEKNIEVERLGGLDRFETSVKIADYLRQHELSIQGRAVIAYGYNFPDALAISSWAAYTGTPILLSDTYMLPSSISKALEDFAITETTVVGGNGVISDQVMAQLPNAKRYAGANRYLTALSIARSLLSDKGTISIATGENFPDALAGSVIAAKNMSAIILVDKTLSEPEIVKFVEDNCTKIKRILVFGGTGVVPQPVVDKIESIVTQQSNPSKTKISEIKSEPLDISAGKSSTLTIRVSITNLPDSEKGNVKLLKIDENGNAVSVLATLHDDGNVENGDDITNDGVFSGKVTFNEANKGSIKLKVAVSDSFSQTKSVYVLPAVSDLDIAYDADFITSIKSKFNELKSQFPLAVAEVNLLNWVKAQPRVTSAKLSSHSILYQMDSGLPGSYGLSPVPNTQGQAVRPRQSGGSSAQSSSTLDTIPSPTVSSRQALVATPFDWQLGGGEIYDGITNNLKNANFAVERLSNNKVTVDTFKQLNKYTIILINTHGGAFDITLPDNTVLPQQVNFSTGEIYTKDNFKTKYKGDFFAGRLAIVSTDGVADNYYSILPRFITDYNSTLPNSIIFNSACDGLINNTLWDALQSKGAIAYYAYDNSIYSSYNFDIAPRLVKALVEGNTTQDVYNIAAIPQDDDTWAKIPTNPPTPALLRFTYDAQKQGNMISISKTEITNGSFETGGLAGWAASGDVRVISQLGPLKPTNGSYMAMLSTGLGSINDSNSLINQVFYIPPGAKTISLDYDVISEEPLEWVGSIYDDQFEANVIDLNGNVVNLARESVNTSNWGKIEGIDFYGGDNTVYHTGVKTITKDISNYGGKYIKVEFHIWDRGDSEYDTAAIIDNIKVE